MKRIERHKLKENDFARTVEHAREVLGERRRDITLATALLIVVIVAIGGYAAWRSSQQSRASGMLASALAVFEAPVVPPAPPAPGSAPPLPQPGTYQSEDAKLNAALPKFVETATRYPKTNAGVTARYYAAGIFASLGRFAEAEQQYQLVIDQAGGTIYGATARLGLAGVQVAQGKYDSAINVYTELSRDTTSQLPLDGVLIQLGRAYVKAGKKDEAARAFTRVVDEFPQSVYVADARRELEESKKS
jgi:predicted negative regulator of RcsB-dependent stress response